MEQNTNEYRDNRIASMKALAELGVKVESFDTIESALAAKPKFLVVGMRALSRAQGLEKAVERIEDGMKLLVMQQRPDVWKALGFSVEDSMARQMYNVALHGVDDLDLAHWAGAPIADAQFGNVMKHDTRRGPRWTHTHAVSSTPILIPQRAGIVPLVRGEFDMSYSALLKERGLRLRGPRRARRMCRGDGRLRFDA